MTPLRRCRSFLAVPAHRAAMVAKAAASEADAVFMDLEDAVPEAKKVAALEGARGALDRLDWGRKHVAVRLNVAGGPSIAQEVFALCARPRLDAVILPKAEDAAVVRAVADAIRAASGGRERPAELELLVETARGLAEAERLADADPLVAALHLGVSDLAASLGARSVAIGASPDEYRHRAEGGVEVPLDLFAYPMMRLLVAARAFGLRAIDGPWGAFADETGTAAAARKAAAMGFDGKQVIHPRQIGLANAAFTPTEEEVAFARKVAAAMEAAQAEGLGAVVVDGRMVDEASLRQIRSILDRAG